MARRVTTARAERIRGRKPGPEQRDECMRIWDAVEPDRRKLLNVFARGIAQDAGPMPPNTPLLMQASAPAAPLAIASPPRWPSSQPSTRTRKKGRRAALTTVVKCPPDL